MDIAPFRGLRYNTEKLIASGAADAAEAVTAPPYDVISEDDHRALLARSPMNVTALTLGLEPGAEGQYERRAEQLEAWIRDGVLVEDGEHGFYVYEIDYELPGSPGDRRRFLGLVALGRQYPFEEGVVLRHEETFAKVVDDRLRLLEATRTHLESIFLLYADAERRIDSSLEQAANGDPVVRVEAKPREWHALYRLADAGVVRDLVDRFSPQRPIIADGHHRYTMGHRYRTETGAGVPGSAWQLMTFANLFGEGLAILATHRLVRLRGSTAAAAMERISAHLEPVPDADAGGSNAARDLLVETADDRRAFRFPAELRSARKGVEATDYGLLHGYVLDDLLGGNVESVAYYKEGTGEAEALQSGAGDLLFRMNPVGREEFQRVVEGGGLYPHKTTYFYPKLWSGLVLWRLAEREGAD